jgi:hypothetical protein
MCELNKKSGTTRIDPCLRQKIEFINEMDGLKTLSSCCGHSKYDESIVVMDKLTRKVFEFNTVTFLSNGKRKGNRYYKKDKDDHYYIPELVI